MRVALVRELGGPEVLVPAEQPDPVAGPDKVVIDVSDVDTLFMETQIRSGAFRDYFPVVPPYVPGGGIAGTVRTVGEGVDARWAGPPAEAAAGRLRPVIGQVYPLEQAAQAHAAIEGRGLLGKVLLSTRKA
ncbi:zinc-binding dehydrogenase [Streptomyces sp. NPDC005151]